MPLLSGSESFSPSVFMSVDTRVGLSTFGGVTKFGDTQGRPLNLCSRSSISIPSLLIQWPPPNQSELTSVLRTFLYVYCFQIIQQFIVAGKWVAGLIFRLVLLPILLASLVLALLKLRLSRAIDCIF